MQLFNGEKTHGCWIVSYKKKNSVVLKSISLRLLGTAILY